MNQLPFKTDKGTFLIIEIAPDATDVRISSGLLPDSHHKGDLIYKTNLNVWGMGDAILPQGNWQIIGNIWELTEEQAKGVVDKFIIGYEDYEHTNADAIWYFENAVESFQSLLKSLNVHKENPYGEDYDRFRGFYYVEEWMNLRDKAQQTTFTNAVLLKQI